MHFQKIRARIAPLIAGISLLNAAPSGAADLAPVYRFQGKTPYEWANELYVVRFGKFYGTLDDEPPTPQQLEARRAVREIGTNALPIVSSWLSSNSWAMAVLWFETLADQAESAVPHLIQLLRSDDPLLQNRAAFAAGAIGPAASSTIPELKLILKSGNYNAAKPIARVGCKHPDVIKDVRKLLASTNSWIQDQAVEALGLIGNAASEAAPELVNLLETLEVQGRRNGSEFVRLRQRIIRTLGLLHDRRALPLLIRLRDEYSDARSSVDSALRKELIRAIAEL